MEDKRRYNTEEFAKKVNVSSRTIRRLDKEGKITPNITITGKKFFTDEHVLVFFGED